MIDGASELPHPSSELNQLPKDFPGGENFFKTHGIRRDFITTDPVIANRKTGIMKLGTYSLYDCFAFALLDKRNNLIGKSKIAMSWHILFQSITIPELIVQNDPVLMEEIAADKLHDHAQRRTQSPFLNAKVKLKNLLDAANQNGGSGNYRLYIVNVDSGTLPQEDRQQLHQVLESFINGQSVAKVQYEFKNARAYYIDRSDPTRSLHTP